MQRVKNHDHLRRGAVRDGYDAAVGVHVVRVDLGDHQGDLGVHAERGALVDDDTALSHRHRCVDAAHGRADRHERDVALGEERGRGQLNLDLLTIEGDALADGPLRRAEAQRGHGEVALTEHLKGNGADRAGRADQNYAGGAHRSSSPSRPKVSPSNAMTLRTASSTPGM